MHAQTTVLAGIRAGGTLPNRLPASLFKACSGYFGGEGVLVGLGR